MKHESIIKSLTFFVCVFLMISFSACKTTIGGVHIDWGPESKSSYPHEWKKASKNGPPPHAPAHGYRAKYAYRYYPDSRVYFDLHRNVYFYLAGDNWRMSVSLPQDIRVQLAQYVTIEMDNERPYSRFEEHSRKYPPGQMKKKGKWAKKK